MVRLVGKVALVTGGGSEIGRATAELFDGEGARMDVTRAEDVAGMVRTAVDTYGRLDVLFLASDESSSVNGHALYVEGGAWAGTTTGLIR